MSKLNITMSWDDGSPSDIRLAELLSKYNIASTFYIPKKNSEGLSVLNNNEIRSIAEEFEIGAHTIDHVRLKKLSDSEHQYQIRHGKDWLEDVTGRSIYGFCYPGGVYNDRSIDAVIKAGYLYSRTTENFSDRIFNNFEMPTTLQLFNHKSYILLLNILRSKNTASKFLKYHKVLSKKSFLERFKFILKYAIENKLEYLHFWGHSWELDENNYWSDLEDVFKILDEHSEILEFKTNYECAIAHSN